MSINLSFCEERLDAYHALNEKYNDQQLATVMAALPRKCPHCGQDGRKLVEAYRFAPGVGVWYVPCNHFISSKVMQQVAAGEIYPLWHKPIIRYSKRRPDGIDVHEIHR